MRGAKSKPREPTENAKELEGKQHAHGHDARHNHISTPAKVVKDCRQPSASLRLGLEEPARPQPSQRSQSSAVAVKLSTDDRPEPNFLERARVSTEQKT